jgi:hypothetical protein
MPMNIVSLARTPQEKVEREKRFRDGPGVEEMEDYPGGLVLHLGHDELQKLGFASGGLESGDKVVIIGGGTVTATNSQSINGMQERSVSLQVQSLALELKEEEEPRANLIYGD